MTKDAFRFLYICPRCGNIIFKSVNYFEGDIRIKCQKCGRVYSYGQLAIKKLSASFREERA